MRDPRGLRKVLGQSQSMAAETHHTDLLGMPAKLTGWNSTSATRPTLGQTDSRNQPQKTATCDHALILLLRYTFASRENFIKTSLGFHPLHHP